MVRTKKESPTIEIVKQTKDTVVVRFNFYGKHKILAYCKNESLETFLDSYSSVTGDKIEE